MEPPRPPPPPPPQGPPNNNGGEPPKPVPMDVDSPQPVPPPPQPPQNPAQPPPQAFGGIPKPAPQPALASVLAPMLSQQQRAGLNPSVAVGPGAAATTMRMPPPHMHMQNTNVNMIRNPPGRPPATGPLSTGLPRPSAGPVPHAAGPGPVPGPHAAGPGPGPVLHAAGPVPGPHAAGPGAGPVPHAAAGFPPGRPSVTGPLSSGMPRAAVPGLPRPSAGPGPGPVPHPAGPGSVPRAAGPSVPPTAPILALPYRNQSPDSAGGLSRQPMPVQAQVQPQTSLASVSAPVSNSNGFARVGGGPPPPPPHVAVPQQHAPAATANGPPPPSFINQQQQQQQKIRMLQQQQKPSNEAAPRPAQAQAQQQSLPLVGIQQAAVGPPVRAQQQQQQPPKPPLQSGPTQPANNNGTAPGQNPIPPSGAGGPPPANNNNPAPGQAQAQVPRYMPLQHQQQHRAPPPPQQQHQQPPPQQHQPPPQQHQQPPPQRQMANGGGPPGHRMPPQQQHPHMQQQHPPPHHHPHHGPPPHGGPPPQQHGGPPPQQHGGPPPQQHGGPPPQQHGGPPPQQHGGPPPQQQHQQQQQPPPPQQQQPPPQPHPGMRELRVEDALMYLDDVKTEFKDRPRVYNEFLGIMKNFKSQEVDTPGVIARVSKLFRGYNKLILGFNTFLPDGYKISLADLERQEAERNAQERLQGQVTGQQAEQQRRKQLAGPPSSANAPPPQQQRVAPIPAQPPQQQQQPPRRPPPQWQRERGEYPPSHEEDTRQQQAPPQLQQQQRAMPPHASSPQQQQPAAATPAPPPAVPPQQQQPPPQPQQRAPAAPPQPKQAPPPPPAAHQHQAVEFDHAISYVTTIKRRFANDPSTYHTFLEILHTYQKEQRGIKEVLEQVAHLFQDHPDLLKEFTFFLPDAVQEQAKERLHRAAADSEARQMAQRQQQMEQYHQSMGGSATAPAPAAAPAPPTSHQKFIDMTQRQMGAAEAETARSAGRKRPFDGQPQVMAAKQPEAYVYNSAVERQFFDATREALSSYSRDGGQAWAEFLKCLDMYAQEILSRSEMLNFVEPLLGKRNTKLFEEFKRILAAAGSPSGSSPMMEDSWYSVPLSEIDFSRCRRCTPSYRALPRDYPAPPCSDRTDEEAKILNDVWVSLPVGSEESYTFRHMRRNTYEETLFRCEDERFEIDMAIDSNSCVLTRLEPIAEEIAQLGQEELVPMDLGCKPPAEGAGMGGKRFQYTFDKKILGVIHRNSIARIYGDAGAEMLDLMVKNPTVAVPVIVQRLRQKDKEWRAVRQRLNRHWKELAEQNYYKSLDNRSLTWRTTDKRSTSTRTLISEIKDRAVNEGRESKEALRLKLEKAKEEHGTFYEVTMGETLSKNLDLTLLPKPDRRLFTPHLAMMYHNNSWVQRDAYRILAFALERGSISPTDKERCHRLWMDLLGPWFGLSLNWMQRPAVTYQESTAATLAGTKAAAATIVSEEDDEESMDEGNDIEGRVVTEVLRQGQPPGSKGFELTDHHPLPAGAHVSTLYGEGKIVQFRPSDNVYVVLLGFGATGYLRPATVLSSLLPVEKSAYTRQLRNEDRTKLARPGDQLLIGTQGLYLFFRLHQILVQRLNTAMRLAYSVGEDQSLTTMVEQMDRSNPNATGRRRYESYLSLVYGLLDGGAGGVGGAAEGGKYEDRVRSLLGHGAFELATMDKLIAHIWKNLQSVAQDETMWNLVQIYRRHMDAGSFQPEAYRQEAAYMSDGETMYVFQHCPVPGKDDSVLYTEHLGAIDDVSDDIVEDMVEAPRVEEPVPAPVSKRPRR